MEEGQKVQDIKKELEGKEILKVMEKDDKAQLQSGYHANKLVKEKPNFLEELKAKQKQMNLKQ